MVRTMTRANGNTHAKLFGDEPMNDRFPMPGPIGQAPSKYSGFPRALWFLLVVCMVALPLLAHGAGGDVIWQFDDAMSGKQESKATVVDTHGDVIVTGYQNLAGGTNDDYYTVKFKGDGSGVAWRAAFDKAGGSDQATAIAVDSNNDVIVTGYVWSGLNIDIHTIKYDSGTGAVVWQHTFNGAANGLDRGTSVAVDNQRNVYVGGYSQNGSGATDYIVLKYAPGGGAPLWQATYHGPAGGANQLSAIAAGGGGIAVTGQSWNGTAFDMATVGYDYSGTKLWEKRYSTGGANFCAGRFVKLDGAGNVLVSGSVSNGIDLDIYTAKYSGAAQSETTPPAPALLWERTYNNAYDDEPKGLAVDQDGSVFVTGYTWTLAGRNNYYTARYDGGNGALIWDAIFDSGTGSDDITTATGIVVDPAADVFVTGYTITAGNADFQTIKYKKENGNQLWQSRFNGAANLNDRPVGIGLSPAGLSPTGDLLVAGWSDSGANDFDYYVIKYDPGMLNPPAGLTAQILSNTSVRLDWTRNSTNEDGVKIERCAGLGCTAFAQIATVGAGITTFTDTGLARDTFYSYRVKTYNGANGDSHYSNIAQALTTYVAIALPAWSFVHNGQANSDDYINAIAVGPDNNPVVTGYTNDYPPGYSTGASFDYLTVKLNRLDRSPIWSDRYNDPTEQSDIATCIAVDSANVVTVSGYATLYNNVGVDVNSLYTLRYPASGPPPSMGDQYNGPFPTGATDDRAVAIATATDASRNVAVVGYGLQGDGNDNIYLLKYLPDGTRAWAAAPLDVAGGDDIPTSVAFASDGSIYVTGYSERAANTNVYNFFTARYSGSNGSLIWRDVYSVTPGGDNRGYGLVVDGAGDVYVSGYATNAAGNRDFYTIKYRGGVATAQRIWERVADGSSHGDDQAAAIGINPTDGNIVAAGTTLSASGDSDFRIIKYTPAGTVVWDTTYQRPGTNEVATAMAIDAHGYAYVTGHTDNGNGTTIDSLTVRFDAQGTIGSATLFNGVANGNDDTNSIAVNSLGEVFASGYTENAAGNADYLVYKIAPPAPTGLTATAAGTALVNLAWNDTPFGETGFAIERCMGASCGGTDFVRIDTVAAHATSYVDTGVCNGSVYRYRIIALGDAWQSLYSDVVTAATSAGHQPGNFSAVRASEVQINLSWTDTNTDESGYLVERCQGSDCTNFTLLTPSPLPPNTSSYSDTNLPVNTTFTYRLTAVKSSSCGWQMASLPVAATTALLPPAALAAQTNNTTQVTLSWTNRTTTETGIKIERCLGVSCGDADFVQIGIAPAQASSYTDNGVCNGTVYQYRVTALGNGWESLPAGPVTAATSAAHQPGNFSAVRASEGQINLSWTDTNTDESGYSVERCQGPGCSDFTLLTPTPLPPNSTSYSDANLPVNTSFTYRLSAVKSSSCGWQMPSPPATAATTLLSPTALAAQVNNTTQASLTWTNHTASETGFEIQRCQGSNCNDFATVGTAAPHAATYPDSTLCSGAAYSYQVRAVNATVPWNSGFSNAATVSIPAPAVPQLTATKVSEVGIDLSWTDGVADESGFRVERCAGTGCSTFGVIATLPPNTVSYADRGLAVNTSYTYRIKGYKTASCPWESVSNQATMATTLAPPANLTANAVNSTRIDLTWTNGTTTETGLAIERCMGASCTDFTQIYVANARSTSFSDTSVCNGSGYSYRIRATNSLVPWDSDYSTANVSLTPAYSNILTDPGFENAVSGWTVPVGTISGTSIDSAVSFDGAKSLKLTAAGTILGRAQTVQVVPNQQYVLSGYLNAALTAGAARCKVVGSGLSSPGIAIAFGSANNNAGWMNLSETVTIPSGVTSVTVQCYADSASQGIVHFDALSLTAASFPLTVTPVNETRINLSWNDVTRDETGFAVLRCAGDGCTELVQVGTAGPNSTSYTDNGLAFNTLYRYQVQSYKAATCPWTSSSSSIAQATTAIMPPGNLTGQIANTTQINLSWQDNTATETGFKVEKCTGAGCADYLQVALLSPNSTSWADTAVATATTYQYRVRATNSTNGWDSDYSTPIAVTSPTLVAPVLTAASASDTQVNLSWTDPTTDESKYVVSRCTGSGCTNFVERATLSANATTYQDSGLTAGVTYTYQVNGVKNATFGWTNSSNAVAAAPVPPAPVSLAATAVNTTRINLTWANRTTTHTGIAIERCEGSGCSNFAQIGVVTAAPFTSFTDNSVCTNTSYSYRVQAANSTVPWTTDYSNVAVRTTAGAVAPSGLTAAKNSEVRVTLNWTGGSSDATGYNIYRCAGALCTPTTLLTATTGGATSYADTSASANTIYGYKVTAYKNPGTGACPWESAATTTATADTTATAPGSLTATAVNSANIQLAWQDNTASETGFLIERCQGSGCADYTQIAAAPASATSWSDATVAPGTAYQYRIRATSSIATPPWDSGYSNTAAAATPGQGAPSNLAASTLTTRVVLTWADNTADETQFLVQRCQGSGCSDFTTIATAPANSSATATYTDTSVCSGQTYLYQIEATRTVTPSYTTPASNIVTVTTQTPGDPLLTATQTTESEINLAWNDPTGDETGYTVERCLGAGCSGFAQLVSLPANTTSYADIAVMPGYSYTYRLHGNSNASCGWQTTSNTATATTSIRAPATLTATVVNTNRINLSWSDSNTYRTAFGIERCTVPGGQSNCANFAEIAVTNGTTLTYADTAVAAGTTYAYRVRTKRTIPYVWNSDYSSTVQATTPTPSAPQALTAVGAANPRINLTWIGNSTDLTGYAVESCSGQNCRNFTEITRVAANVTAYENQLLAPSTSYCYRVRSYKTGTAGWYSPYSNTACAVTIMDGPVTLTAAADNSMTVHLNWPDSSSGEDGYVVEAQLWNGEWTTLASLAANVTNYYDTVGINPQSTYIYRVRSYRGADYSAYTNPATVTTPPYGSGDNTCATGPNDAPVFTSTPVTVAMENTPYSYAVTAVANGGGTVTYTLSSKPAGMTIQPAGVISWTPDYGQTGSANVTVRATDSAGRTADQSFVITVARGDRTPTVTAIPNSSVVAGHLFSYQIAASDPDGDNLTYSLSTTLTGMSVSPAGLITWTAGSPADPTMVTVSASDGTLSASQSFTITVTQNHPPTVTSSPVTTGTDGVAYSYQVTVNNPDGCPLSYFLTTAPAGMTISTSGLITWAPAASQVGAGNQVTVQVSDGGAVPASQSFTVNLAQYITPSIMSTPVTTAAAGVTYSYAVFAVSPGGGALTYSLTPASPPAPAGMTISPAGVVSWTPAANQLGSYPVTVTVTAGSASATQSFTVTVLNPPPPILTPQGGNPGSSYCSSGHTLAWNAVTAPDGDPVAYNVQVDTVNTFNSGDLQQSNWQAGTSWPVYLGTGGTWYWRVQARDNVHAFAVSAWSAAGSFTDGSVSWDCGCDNSCSSTSCPLVYSWNGTKYGYETDLQGPAISQIKKGLRNVTLYQPSYIVLGGLATDANNQYRVKIWESLQEASLIDEAKLLVVDYPEGYRIVSSSAENTYYYGYADPFKIYTIKDPVSPIAASDKNGNDILASVLSVDNNPVPMAPNDPDNFYTLDFGTIQHPENAKLVIDGWQDINSKIYLSTVTIQPYLEVADANGAWVKVKTFGMPAGDLKSMVIDIANIFLSSDRRIRLHLGIKKAQVWVFDRIRLDDSAPVSVTVQALSASSADLQLGGQAIVSMPAIQHRLMVSDENLPLKPDYFGFGSFTRYGEVRELLTQRDDKYVIMNYADKLELAFPALPPPQPGKARGFVLKVDNYYKDFKDYKYLEPLPFHGMSDYPPPAPEAYPTDADHVQYLQEYNTRQY
jgi:uncharacterized delta-60 repeat protein